jgi:hypothetical protein
MTRLVLGIALASALAGCAPSTLPDVNRLAEDNGIVNTGTITLPDPDTGQCRANDVTPAVVETVTEQVILEPAELGPGGTVLRPAIYETKTRQEIVRDRREQEFQALCEARLTPELITNLQRALGVRGFYKGQPTGELNWRTRRGIRLYQLDQRIDSAILSYATAQQLGLIAYEF